MSRLKWVVTGTEIPPLFKPGDLRKTITLAELSELTGVKVLTLRSWLRRGIIPGAFQRGKNSKWHFRREMLEPWWEELLTRHLDRR